ncbi:hypothetical protein [Streptomyces sp. Ag109_G2-15]|uniref:hypothetical protein n=1 Tax=Streptomyces sp. Ag109_G2-15 TaxID=1938850 RepID=UPI000BD7E427|nr:hypothetical protein SAMN06272765_7910 [Streptomyces sp. Ag109_G2-15]
MIGSAHVRVDAARRERARRGSAGTGRARVIWPLAAVAAAFTLAQLLLVRPGMGLGWDETVYVSQVSGHAPAAFFSAPRARGVSLLVAPVAAWSSSTALLRVYLAVLSGLALFLALRAWRGLFPVRVLALAGGLFASLWVTLFYGPQAMPNYWVAVGALAAVACFLRARTDRADRAALWGLGASAALMAWMRPVDAVWVTLPLLALGLVRHHWRPLLVLLTGLAAGALEWVIEAYVSYGGLAQRLSDGSAIQGGLGLHFAVVDQLRSLGGRALCRPCTGALPNPVVTVWWFALPLLAALGLTVAVRARRTATTLLPLACAATAAVPYLFMIGYAAPRFLLPAYALLSIPVAVALVHLVTAPSRVRRPVAVALLALGLAAHLAVQLTVLLHTVDRTTAAHRDWSRTADTLHRLGVRPPCLLTGHEAIPVAFYAGCSSAATTGHNANSTAQAITGTARHTPVATLVPAGSRPPGYARSWPSVPLDGLRLYYAVPEAGS